MTKYIELLRAHQKQKTGVDSPPKNEHIVEEQVSKSEKPNDEMHNPYSKSARANEMEADSTPDLIEESTLPVVQAPSPVVEHDLLIAEEEIESTAAASDETSANAANKAEHHLTADATVAGLNTGNNNTLHSFNVSTWLQNLNQIMSVVFQDAQEEKPTDFSMLNTHLTVLLSAIEGHSKTLDALELEISRTLQDMCQAETGVNDLVAKSIMMMLYTIKICIQLKLQHTEIVHHTVAAMVHHIGMSLVAKEIRQKIGKLTKDEIKLIRKAPQNAVTYLQTCALDHDNILLAASQSSERYDGSGASGLSGHSIAWIARVVGLLSMFEALIHFRPYRQRLLPRDAIRELVNKHKKEFDPVMLKALIESVSLYPVGTFVQLNTGEIGQVIIVHNKFPLRPIVYINMDKHGNAITEREIDLKKQPNLMIQKCMYEEALTASKEGSI